MIGRVCKEFKCLVVIHAELDIPASQVSQSLMESQDCFFLVFSQTLQNLPEWLTQAKALLTSDSRQVWQYLGAYESANQQSVIFSDLSSHWLPYHKSLQLGVLQKYEYKTLWDLQIKK